MINNYTLSADENLGFLINKTQEIKKALFKADINSVLRLPNNIITTLKTDNNGYIWFYTSCNGHYAKSIDKSFYAYLEYYQKGGNNRLRISGAASIIESSGETDTAIDNVDNMVLVKLKIFDAEYIEDKPIVTTSYKDTIKNFFYYLVYGHPYRQFDVE